MSRSPFVIQISATFTAEPLSRPLEFWMEKLGLCAEIRFSPYAQVFQQALDPASESAANASGFNLFLIRADDLAGGDQAMGELADALASLASRSSATQLVIWCPHADRTEESSLRERQVSERLAPLGNVMVLPVEDWVSLYPVDQTFDADADAAGNIPFTAPLYAALATAAARAISAHSRPPAKVLVLDADNTLWGGVCGEDGPGGLTMDGAWRELRDFALEKRSEGLLLCLCSKNSETDIDRVFTERFGDLGLAREHFAGWKVNWQPKSQNLQELATELNLGIDSFVFLDDNPAEIAEVAANCPGVVALRLPDNPEGISHFLRHLWCLDRVRVTEEDAKRADFFVQETKRRELCETAPSFEDFLRGLELRIDIHEADSAEMSRVAQLTHRTNQFNAHPIRLSEGELTRRLNGSARCLAVTVADRFGDYGLVGTAAYRPNKDQKALPVDLFLLSCRAMGKGVERAMIVALAEKAREYGAEKLELAFTPTDRNEPCRRFLESIGAQLDENDGVFRIDTDLAENLSLIPDAPGKGKSGRAPSAPRSTAVSPAFSSDLACRIVSEWSDPNRLHALLSAGRRARPEIAQACVKPGTPTQQKIASIWRDVLELEQVGIEDPFSALGGTSIQLVSAHTLIRREFDTSIELADLFELPTIAALAARIDAGKAAPESLSPLAAPVKSGCDPDDDAVAIVGMALRVPGANSPEQLWENLVNGVESISRFTREEIENPEDYDKPGFVPAKGIIDAIDKFDGAFFGILPKEAQTMDPQQRIFLELAWEVMERSGYQPDNHRQRIGVYAGAYFDSYLLANLCTDRAFLADLIPSIQVGSLQTELGNDKDYLATRAAFKLNLRGPAMTIQSACSTSMVAVVEACRAIRSGLCDMALAGGVTLTLPLKRGYSYTEQGMLSGDGHCRAFDEQASGTVFGNGAGVVMLKRLSDAIRDRDHIHAVIRGTGLNNDGGIKHSYTAPSVEGQSAVIRMAHQDAGIDPATIGCIEAHGTGTPLGDPIEVTALTKAFRAAGVSENQFCAIGSLKTNIGHLDVASGVCGLIKTALSLEKAQLPPLLHFQKANPKIDFASSPFFPIASLTPWTTGRNGAPRRAGVSSFGVGGTNAHIVMEEAPTTKFAPSHRREQIFLLSARTEETLNVASRNLADFARHPGDTQPADAAWTLAVGRKPFRCRRAVVAGDFSQLAEIITAGPGIRGVADRSHPPVNFLFPGQGAQHVNMARAFYESEPRFRQLIDHCSEVLRPHLDLDLTSVLFPRDGEDLEQAADRLKHTVLAQPAIFVVEYAMADLWRRWSIEPAAMIGHSVGEFVAACHAGVFDLESGLELLAMRGRLMGELPGGGMLSVRAPERDLLDRLPETLDLAAVNGASLCVVAGPHEELDTFAKSLEADGVAAQRLHTSHAFHSRMMDPVIDRFAACFEKIALRAPQIPILSSVTGQWLTEAEATDSRYWARHLRETVRFHEAVSALGEEKPEQIFVEVGPGQTLTGLARQSLDRKAGHHAVSTCRHVKEQGSDYANALESLGRLWTLGVEVDWEAFYALEERRRVVLPTYPFERKRHWVDPKPFLDLPGGGPAQAPIAAETVPPSVPEPVAPLVQTLPGTVMSTPPTASRRDAIGAAIRSILADLSGIPEEELAGDATFLELGFDSLLLTQVSKIFQTEFATEVTMRQLMADLSSIDAMVAHLDDTMTPDRFRESPPASAEIPEPAPSAPLISAMTPPQPAAPFPPQSQPSPAMVHPAGSNGVGASFIEGVIAQQMELMRAQLALLQNGSAPAPVAVPPSNPAPAPTASPASAPASAPKAAEVSAPNTAINRSIDDRLTPRQQGHLDELIANYTRKTRTSKELTAKHRRTHADPRTVSGFHRLWKEMVYQIVVTESKGTRLLDIDGNEYLDLLNGFGPGFLGHSPDFITEALHRQLDRGIELGPQSLLAMEAAELFCELTGNERASFVNTGSEAVQAAIRLSRTVTGRDKIVVFARDYHGNFDEMLVRGVGSGEKLRSIPVAPGIPHRAVEDVIVLPYGSDEAVEVIRRMGSQLAAVIVEPIQSRRPEFRPAEFIREIRDITRQSGSLFVFDEVITGLRTGPRGAQEFYGVEADIATYGKVVGGGLPIGVVAGKAEFMDTFDGGMWQYGDDSMPEKGVTFFAGTFVRHPLAMAAAKQVLLHLRDQGPDYWAAIRQRADRLAGTVDRMMIENEMPIRMPNFGSQMFVRVADDQKLANLLFYHLRHKGVFLLEGFPTYLTAAHTEADVDYAIDAFRESVAELQEGGFFTRPAGLATPQFTGSRLSGPPRQLSGEKDTPKPPTGQTRPEPVAESGSRLYPMTEPLAEVWLASQVSEAASLGFNEIITLTFRGRLDGEALRQSLEDLTRRHEALRAVFEPDGEGFRIRPADGFELPLLDLTEFEPDEKRRRLDERIDLERATVFDLVEGPLFRACLIRVAHDEHVLVLNGHHLVCDGWSILVIESDLSRIYAARAADQPPLFEEPAKPYGKYVCEVAWKENQEQESASERYWLDRFANPVPPLSLPLDRPRSGDDERFCDAVVERLDEDACRNLKRLAGRSGATLFGLLMSAYQALLHRISRQESFVVAFPSAGQNTEGNETVVGHCVNFLPLVARIDPNQPFSAFVREVQQNLLGAMEHQDFGFGRLIKKLEIDRAEGERPLVEAVFNFERMDVGHEFPGLETTVAEVDRLHTNNPLFLKAYEKDGRLEIRIDFQTARFSADTMRHWLASFRAILEKAIERPDTPVAEVATALSRDQEKLLHEWNRTAIDYPAGQSIPALFDEVETSRGPAPALRFEDGSMSYSELADLSGRIAHRLSETGGGSVRRVGLFLDRCPELVASQLAILRCGAAIVPLDLHYPIERLEFMIRDSSLDIVITRKDLGDRLPNGVTTLCVSEAARKGSAVKAPGSAVDPMAPAFVLYTSGSTGKPKGTIIPHRAVVRLVRNADVCELGDDQVFIQASSISFDASLFEIYGALLNGGILALPPEGTLSIENLADTIRRHGVTTLWITSGLFQVMAEENLPAFGGLRQVLTGGDVVSADHARRIIEAHPDIRLIACYGPTENTTFTTCHPVTPADLDGRPLPIGRALANNTVWVLDDRRNPVPPGIPGELWVGGDGLALEYLNNPGLTAERFIADPFSEIPGARLYRTGDLGRFRPDGILEFLGRMDHQVKIRGFRVEPGEIEARLGAHPGVKQAKVVIQGTGAGGKTLVAFAAPVDAASITPAELADYLRGKLPDYMVPSAIVILDELPLNSNGKIDSRALPLPGSVDPASEVEGPRLPPTPTESALADIWRELLRGRQVGLDDNFFSVGGHSLLGMRMFSRIGKRFGLSLPLATLFKASTIRQLARVIDEANSPSPSTPASVEPPAVFADFPAAPLSARAGANGGAANPATKIADTTVAIQPKGDRRPIFAVHGGDGGILFYCKLATLLGEERPFYAFEAPALTAGGPIPDEPVEKTAATYIRELRKVQPEGPYLLCGYSFGGVVAYEMACQLADSGDEISFLGLVDTENPAAKVRQFSLTERVAFNWQTRNRAEAGVLEKMGSLGKRVGTGLAYRLRFSTEGAVARALPPAKTPGWLRMAQIRTSYEKAMEAYSPRPFIGRMILFRARQGNDKYDIGDFYGWDAVVSGGVEIIEVPGNHITIFDDENIESVADAFRQALSPVPV